MLQRLQPMKRLQPLQNGQFGSKIKNAKNMRRLILQEHYSCSVQKTAPKNTNYSRNEAILKIGHLAKAIAHVRLQALQYGRFRSKIKNAKNMRKTILQEHQSCSVQKTLRKNTKYSRNETILKIDHLAKAIAHVRLQALQYGRFRSKIKNAKNMRKTILQEHQSCSVQKTVRKTPNIREMRQF